MSKFTTEQLWKEWERDPEGVYRFVVTGQLFTSSLKYLQFLYKWGVF